MEMSEEAEFPSPEHVDEEAIDEYLMGRLSEEDAQALERHVQNCTECSIKAAYSNAFLEAMKRLRKDLTRAVCSIT